MSNPSSVSAGGVVGAWSDLGRTPERTALRPVSVNVVVRSSRDQSSATTNGANKRDLEETFRNNLKELDFVIRQYLYQQ